MTPRIYFFANFGNWSRQPYGIGTSEATISPIGMMRQAGYDVNLIEKYNRVYKHTRTDAIIISCLMIWNVIKLFYVLLFGRHKNSLVHIVGFYGSTIYFERILVGISHLLGYRTIYEMRGGGATYHYQNGSERYRRWFAATIRQADYIFSQGQENKPLIDSIEQGKHFFYYPNCVMRDFCPEEYPNKPNNRINLLYFGRVAKQKNVDVVVDAFNLLAAKYSNIYLDVVGNCTEPAYAEEIRRRIRASAFASRITMHSACSHDKLKEHLADKHFYVFPTTEPREGHSNALTEAMAWGLIPVATDMGFNRTIIGEDMLIVKQASPIFFANVVANIVDNGRTTEFSEKVYYRTQANYTEEIIYNRLKEEYNALLR